jgi:hypothetical protein
MNLLGLALVGFPNFSGGRVFLDSENLVVVLIAGKRAGQFTPLLKLRKKLMNNFINLISLLLN